MSSTEPPPPYSIGSALSYGWVKFTENLNQILLAVLVLFVVYVAAGAIAFGFVALLTSDESCSIDSAGTLTCEDGSGYVWRTIVSALAIGLLYVVGQVVGAGIIRGALGITEGRPFQVAEMFRIERLGPVIVASLMVGIATSIGYALFYLPGIVIAFVTSYTLFFVIDQRCSPIEAIQASYELVKNNLAHTIVWYVVGGLIAVAGVIICFVGLLVTIPVVLIGTAYTYKTLRGDPVAP